MFSNKVLSPLFQVDGKSAQPPAPKQLRPTRQLPPRPKPSKSNSAGVLADLTAAQHPSGRLRPWWLALARAPNQLRLDVISDTHNRHEGDRQIHHR